MLTLSAFKKKAFELFGVERTERVHADPMSFLYALDWDIPIGPAFSEVELAHMNVDFDERGCFGRAVKAAVLVEKYFPEEIFFMGEVCESLLRTILMEDITSENWADDTYIAEILQYENPHLVLVWKDQQFDPFFKQLSDRPHFLKHPSIVQHKLWEGLYCSYLESSAMLSFTQKHDIPLYVQILTQAQAICPDMIGPKEILVHALCKDRQYDESIRVAKSLVGKRKDARGLWALWKLTEEEMYRDQIVKQYDIKMLDFLNKTQLL